MSAGAILNGTVVLYVCSIAGLTVSTIGDYFGVPACISFPAGWLTLFAVYRGIYRQ
jgi:hypothetical protein